MASSSEAAVQATNDDASASKLSCVNKGYIEDKFVKFFVRRPVRRSPIINRGYYARWAAMRTLLLQFLDLSSKDDGSQGKQILSIGAGFDTLFFNLHVKPFIQWSHFYHMNECTCSDVFRKFFKQATSNSAPSRKKNSAVEFETEAIQKICNNFVCSAPLPFQEEEGLSPHLFVELDFLEVTRKKITIITSHEQLVSKLGPDPIISKDKGEILSEHYKLLPGDLRDLNGLDEAFKQAQLDPSLPTLILAECVLIYMEPEASRNVVKWAAEKISTGIFVLYEQIHPDDAFGHQMMKNLKSRGCPLLGLDDTPTLEAKIKRFTDLGWHRAEAQDMDFIYNQCLDPNERRRTERLEIFDEFEEWHIMQEHYCVAYGIKDSTGMYEKFGFKPISS